MVEAGLQARKDIVVDSAAIAYSEAYLLSGEVPDGDNDHKGRSMMFPTERTIVLKPWKWEMQVCTYCGH